jgi:hypothetical protein
MGAAAALGSAGVELPMVAAPFVPARDPQVVAFAPGGTITYADNTTVTVPVGALAGAVASIKGAGAVLVCRVDSGAIRLTDPDAMKFPGFDGPPNDRPMDPAAGSVVGWSVFVDPNTRYLDLRTAGRAMWQPAMFKRFEYAKSIGCEGIDAAWIDQADPGFPLVVAGSENDVTLYYADVVADLHARELSAGFHASTPQGKLFTSQFAQSYDFAVTERSAEFDEFDTTRAFNQAGKAEFAIDYVDDMDRDLDLENEGISFTGGCTKMSIVQDWIHKEADATLRAKSGYLMQFADCP